jgi:hypothetical protein
MLRTMTECKDCGYREPAASLKVAHGNQAKHNRDSHSGLQMATVRYLSGKERMRLNKTPTKEDNCASELGGRSWDQNEYKVVSQGGQGTCKGYND